MPALCATPAKSMFPALETVGSPPEDSYCWLSQQIWIRFFGWCRAIVASEPRFIQSAPSPSKTNTLRLGRDSASPRPMDEQSPNVLTWMLPSLGLTAFHSAVAPPAVVTNNSSLIKVAMACRHSKRFISIRLQNGPCQQQSHRPLRAFRRNHRAGDILFHSGRIAHDGVFDSQSLQHRLGDQSNHMKSVVTHISRIVDEEQYRDTELERRSGETITAVQQTAILHQHRRLLSGQMRAGANPDALFFATHRHMRDLLILVQEIDELKHIDVWNARHKVNACFFQAGENLSRSLKGSHLNFLVEDSRYRCQAVMNGAKSPRVKPISFRANGISTARISGRPRQGPGRKTFRGKVSGFFLADRFLLC